MRYNNIFKAEFLSRPNRFIAKVLLNGRTETVHVKNTGRCGELLVPGAQVFLEKGTSPGRKTEYDLVTVRKGSRLVNMDAQAPNRVFYEFAQSGRFMPDLTLIKPEYRLGDSRFDFYMESGQRRILAEIKGVTLERDNVVLFPDAPTERGLKHVRELTELCKEGYECAVVFVVQMEGASYFTPNAETDPKLSRALAEARTAGVHILAYECSVSETEMNITVPVKVIL